MVLLLTVFAIAFIVVSSISPKFIEKPLRLSIQIGLGILSGVILLFGCVVTVPAGHQGILLRFGAVQGSLDEGLHFIVPNVNKVVLMTTQVQKDTATAESSTKDVQPVTAIVSLNYFVDAKACKELYQKVGVNYARTIIDPVVMEGVKAATAAYTAEELIGSRELVKQKAFEAIQKRLQPYGITAVPGGLSFENFAFSPKFNEAVESKQVAQQSAEKQKYVLQQAKLEAETKITQAKGVAESNRITALSLEAKGGRMVLTKEWIEKWDGKLPVVQSGSGGGNLMLNLSDLQNSQPTVKQAE